jgi:hypothetical protein
MSPRAPSRPVPGLGSSVNAVKGGRGVAADIRSIRASRVVHAPALTLLHTSRSSLLDSLDSRHRLAFTAEPSTKRAAQGAGNPSRVAPAALRRRGCGYLLGRESRSRASHRGERGRG